MVVGSGGGGCIKEVGTLSGFHSWAELRELRKAVGTAGSQSYFLLNSSLRLCKLRV